MGDAFGGHTNNRYGKVKHIGREFSIYSNACIEVRDEGVSVGGLGGLPDCRVACARVALGDVFADRSVEQHRFLPHVADLNG